jgi:hypothetical protein
LWLPAGTLVIASIIDVIPVIEVANGKHGTLAPMSSLVARYFVLIVEVFIASLVALLSTIKAFEIDKEFAETKPLGPPAPTSSTSAAI